MNSSPNANETDRFPLLSDEEVMALPNGQRQEYVTRLMQRNVKRYGGNPELMLQENPEMDFLHPERALNRKNPV